MQRVKGNPRCIYTPDRRQLEALFAIDKHTDQKFLETVFLIAICRQSVGISVDNINVFDCRLSGVIWMDESDMLNLDNDRRIYPDMSITNIVKH